MDVGAVSSWIFVSRELSLSLRALRPLQLAQEYAGSEVRAGVFLKLDAFLTDSCTARSSPRSWSHAAPL